MDENDIECGCSTVWLREFAPLESSTATCAGPAALVGVVVNEVPLENLDCCEAITTFVCNNINGV